jgi:hypothetical protein
MTVKMHDSFFVRTRTERFIIEVVEVQDADAESPTKYRLQNTSCDYDRMFTEDELDLLLCKFTPLGYKILERL